MHTLSVLLSKTNTIIGTSIRVLFGGEYNHCAIMLDNDYSCIYSFTRKFKYCWFTGCFTIEPYNRFTDFIKYDIDITDIEYNDIINFLDELNESFRFYNYIGAVLLPLGVAINFKHHFVCSTFVAKILSLTESIGLDKSIHLYKPNDIYNLVIKSSH